MKSIATSLALMLAAAGNPVAAAQATATPPGHANPGQPAAAGIDVPATTRPVVAVVERFGKALAAGDLRTVGTLLAPDVLILESGGADRSRTEYLAHHAISDARFLKDAHVQLQRRRARIAGELAWVGSESELHASKDGKAMILLSTETMVLRKTGAGWRIVHIHWSSRPKKAS